MKVLAGYTRNTKRVMFRAASTAVSTATVTAARRLGIVTHPCHRPTRRSNSSDRDTTAAAHRRDVTDDDTPVCIDTLKVGQVFSLHRTFTPADVAAFARLSRDANPVHLDPNAAAAAGLGGRGPVVHGMLCASLFSGIIGTRFPGAVYATQSLAFRRPVMVGEQIVAEVELVRLGGSRATFATRVLRRKGRDAGDGDGDGDGDGVEVILDGSALAFLKGVERPAS